MCTCFMSFYKKSAFFLTFCFCFCFVVVVVFWGEGGGGVGGFFSQNAISQLCVLLHGLLNVVLP